MSVLMSVVIPAYNVEAYIVPAINSVLTQTVSDLEVIVVDDGSTDGTYQKAESLRSKRVTVLWQPHAGPSVARNLGILASRGRYIGFLDADDFWQPRKAQRHLDVMQRLGDIDLSFAWWRVIDEKGRDTGRRGKPRPGRIAFRELIVENLTGNGSTVVARKSAIEDAGYFDVSFTAMEDHDLWLRIARLQSKNVFCIGEVLSDYRMRPQQATKDWRKLLMNWERLMAKMWTLDPESMTEVHHQASARYRRYLAYMAYEADDQSDARRFLFEALKIKPSLLGDPGSWITTAAVLCTYLPEKIHRGLAEMVKAFRMGKGREYDDS